MKQQQKIKRRRPAFTGVSTGTVGTREQLRTRVQADLVTHRATLQQYHELWYRAPYTWNLTTFLGVSVMKSPNDLWMYQELIGSLRPRTIIETGTYKGGSALWFAFLLNALGIDGQVFTVDIEDHRGDKRVEHPNVRYIIGDSLDPRLVDGVRRHVVPPVLISLDSEHDERHVYDELCLWTPLANVGDWLVVEDTNVSWQPANGSGGDGGPQAGLGRYLAEHPDEWLQESLCERYLLTMNPGGWLERVKRGR